MLRAARVSGYARHLSRAEWVGALGVYFVGDDDSAYVTRHGKQRAQVFRAVHAASGVAWVTNHKRGGVVVCQRTQRAAVRRPAARRVQLVVARLDAVVLAQRGVEREARARQQHVCAAVSNRAQRQAQRAAGAVRHKYFRRRERVRRRQACAKIASNCRAT